MPVFSIKLKDNSGEKDYADFDVSPVSGVKACEVTENGVKIGALDSTVNVYNGATYDDESHIVTLPIKIKGFSNTANSEVTDFGIGDGLTIYAGNNTYYAVPDGGGGWLYD